VLDIQYPSLGGDITLQVMTSTLESTGHQDAVSASLESLEQIECVYLARARQFNDLDVGWISKPHRTG
jgi:hypothetical protein